MWELTPDDSPNTPPISTEFSVNYSPAGNESQFYVYRCPFDITNYKVRINFSNIMLFNLQIDFKKSVIFSDVAKVIAQLDM